jgi:hypothetical protein
MYRGIRSVVFAERGDVLLDAHTARQLFLR